jgi:hypothetical protein
LLFIFRNHRQKKNGGTKEKKMKLNSVGLAVLAAAIVFPSVDLAEADDRVVGAWLFDEGDGNVVIDASGNGHDGEITGDSEWVDGKFDGALQLDRAGNGYVIVPHSEDFNLNEYTIMAWVTVLNNPGWQGVCCKQIGADPWTDINWWFGLNGNGVAHAEMGIDGVNMPIGGQTILADQEWHHIALTYDQDSRRIYVDGVVDAEDNLGGEPAKVDIALTIGAPNPGNANSLDGIVDEVLVANAAFTETEINELMKGGLSGFLTVRSEGKLTATWGQIKAEL